MTSYCSNCAAPLVTTAVSCPKCGAHKPFNIHDSGLFKTLNSYNYIPTIIIGVVAGVFGLHRFYVGKHGSGLVMLLLTITVVFSWVSVIWAIVDLIGMIDGSFFLKLPNRNGIASQSSHVNEEQPSQEIIT